MTDDITPKLVVRLRVKIDELTAELENERTRAADLEHQIADLKLTLRDLHREAGGV